MWLMHQHVFRLRNRLDAAYPGMRAGCADMLMNSTLSELHSIGFLLLGPPGIACLLDACGYNGGSHSSDCRRFSRHREHIGYV